MKRRVGRVRGGWGRSRLGVVVVSVVLAGCVTADGPGEEQRVEAVTIAAGLERLEGLILEAMALVRPGVTEFADEGLNDPRPCDPEDPGGLVFSTMGRSWDDVALSDALAGLDAVGASWAEQGFEVDDSRRDRPVGQEMLATTPDGYELIAIVSVPTADGIARFSVQGGTPCLAPAAG